MNPASTFATYLALKEQLGRLIYRGYDLCKPSAAILANYLYDSKSAQRKWRKAFKLLWIEPRHSNRHELKGRLLAWNTPRADHKQNAEHLAAVLDTPEQPLRLVHVPDINKDCRRALSLKAPWRALRLTLARQIGPRHFLYTLAALTYSIRYFDSVERDGLTRDITTLVAYNSSNMPECFLTTACRRQGVPTFSLQHGLYYDYLTPPPIAIINYENVTADALLVWSDFCREQIQTFHQRHNRALDFDMPVAGYPKPLPEPGRDRNSGDQKRILCLLPRTGLETSIRLVTMLGALPDHYRVLLRPHPSLRKNKAFLQSVPATLEIDENPLLQTTLAGQDFRLAVGFNTTSLFDTLLFNVPCAIYQTPQTSFQAPGLPHFADGRQLLQLLEEVPPNRHIAEQVLGAGIFRYAEIINGAQQPAAGRSPGTA